MESYSPFLFAPERTEMLCSDLILVGPVLCITGRRSWLGNVRSFPGSFFSLYFLSVSLFFFFFWTTHGVHLTMDLVYVRTKHVLISQSQVVSCKNWAEVSICCWHYQLVSAWWTGGVGIFSFVWLMLRKLFAQNHLSDSVHVHWSIMKREWALKLLEMIFFKVFNNVFSM